MRLQHSELQSLIRNYWLTLRNVTRCVLAHRIGTLFVFIKYKVLLFHYSATDREAEYCDERVCLSVSVCLSTIISSKLHVRSSPKFVCMLPVAVAWSSSGAVVICYVFLVLWMTSYLLISQGCSTSPPS